MIDVNEYYSFMAIVDGEINGFATMHDSYSIPIWLEHIYSYIRPCPPIERSVNNISTCLFKTVFFFCFYEIFIKKKHKIFVSFFL